MLNPRVLHVAFWFALSAAGVIYSARRLSATGAGRGRRLFEAILLASFLVGGGLCILLLWRLIGATNPSP